MKKILTMITVLFFLAVTALQAESVFSGNISSVDPRSGFNALRSPALMTFRTRDDISFGYIYSYLVESNPDVDAVVGGLAYNAEIKSEESYNGAFILSSVWHTGDHSWGLGVTKGGDGQVVLGTSDVVLERPVTGDKYTSEENKYIFSSSLLFSYSYRTGNRSSIGVNLETVASETLNDKDDRFYSFGTMLTDNKIESEQTRVSTGLGAGYFFMGSIFEFGAGIKTGRYGFENKKYNYTKKYPAPVEENDEEISNYMIHDEGAGLVTGINIKPYHEFSLAFEAAIGFPYTYEVKECNDDAITLDKYSTDVSVKYAFQVKAGTTYRWGRRITLGAGGSYLKFRSESDRGGSSASGTTDFNIYQATAGVDVKLSYDLSVLFGVNYNLVTGILKQEDSALTMKVDQVSHTVDFITGLSMFY